MMGHKRKMDSAGVGCLYSDKLTSVTTEVILYTSRVYSLGRDLQDAMSKICMAFRQRAVTQEVGSRQLGATWYTIIIILQRDSHSEE